MVEVSGCLTTCMHCWAVGGEYGAMPFDDAAFLLDQLARFSRERGFSTTAYPMHEVTAHPQAPDIIRLFAPHLGGDYDPILTPGSPLASREDWREVMAAAKECGAHALWLAFHGYGDEHDRQLLRSGAFEESCLAVRRAQECGLGTGANVFVTKPGLAELEQLLDLLAELGLGNLSIGTAAYMPTARGRRYEALRPQLDELLPLVPRVLDATGPNEEWNDLASFTEAAWIRRALADEWPHEPRSGLPGHHLVCRTNLDLFTGVHGAYRQHHGNLRRDGVEQVIERAFAAATTTPEALYFPDASATTAELATRFGDPNGTKVYWGSTELRYRWLDQASGRI
jgi:hypothetical protein